MKKVRYPGAQPFDTGQQDIFFGRDKDIDQFYKRIRLERLVVLSGKSGSGKSSLLNAGIIPRAIEDGRYEPLRVRFNAWAEGQQNISPLHTTQETVRKGRKSVKTFLDKLIRNEDTLWHDVKEHQILHQSNEQGLLLLFDQFEELFTYPDEQIVEFRQQLAEAMSPTVPQRYWDQLEVQANKGVSSFSDEEMNILQTPLTLKVALTIRSDRLHLLQRINDCIPINLKDCFELGVLDEAAAAEAIREPAALPAGSEGFECPAFRYDRAAMDKILDFLTDNGTDRIENTQLQIVCHSIEQRVMHRHVQPGASRANGSLPDPADDRTLLTVYADEIGDLSSIIGQYYDDRIALIPDPEQQQAARLLIEDGLILEEEERRLSLYEGQITRTYNVSMNTLQLLVDSHLLRAEPSLQGGYTYELSHDTLVQPVLEAKEERMRKVRAAVEAQLREEQEEKLKREQRRSRRALLFAGAMVLLSAVSGITTFWAIRANQLAKMERIEAETQKNNAEQELLQRRRMELLSDLEKSHIYKDAGYISEAWAVLDTIAVKDTSLFAQRSVEAARRSIEATRRPFD